MSALKIGVIMDPIQNIDINKDTTFVIMLEAQRRGHRLFYMELQDLFIESAVPCASSRPVRVVRGTPHFELGAAESRPLTWFDIVLMRKDPPFDMNFFFATHLLSLVDRRECAVINDPHGLREATEKLYALNFPQIIPPSIVTSSIQRLKDFMDQQGGEMIVKPLEGAGGRGVLYLSRKDRNVNALLEMVTLEGKIPVMGQRYLPEIRTGDKRVLVLDGEPIGALLRVPRDDDNRANIHAGGASAPARISARDRDICAVLAAPFKQLGLHFVGLDVIGDFVTEINVTSPTCVQEINAFDGVKLEEKIVDLIEKKSAAGITRAPWL
ncbi:MAG TPA: glutathione synthase [Candidatus Acidoferrales bacterium]|nr:glutathione synthase [Candidatus Acidoferrales bacterium]